MSAPRCSIIGDLAAWRYSAGIFNIDDCMSDANAEVQWPRLSGDTCTGIADTPRSLSHANRWRPSVKPTPSPSIHI